MDKDEKEHLVAQVPFWWHSIDLGDGVVTPGRHTLEGLQKKIDAMHLPELAGKTVLDVGAWDGFFAFEAERSGARRVVAMDRYVWSLDMAASEHMQRFVARPGGISSYFAIPNYWKPGEMPTKAGFDTAHRILGSMVEQCVDDLATVNLEALGSFDVVFYLGGLYHMENPLRVMRKLATVTREMAIIETAGIFLPELQEANFFEFYGASELNGDSSNWWAPTGAALTAMCRAAGFKDAKIVARTGATPNGAYQRCRYFAHAWH